MIYYVLSTDFNFQESFEDSQHELKEADNSVMNYTLKKLACEVLFNLKYEKTIFSIVKVTECLEKAIKFAMTTFLLDSKSERSELIVEALKMISHLIINSQNLSDLHHRVISIQGF